MTEYTHKTYAAGHMTTTIDGLRKMFPYHAHLITDDMTQDELDALALPLEDTAYGRAMKKSSKALKRSMRETDQNSDLSTDAIEEVEIDFDKMKNPREGLIHMEPTPKPNNIKPLVAAIAYHSRFH